MYVNYIAYKEVYGCSFPAEETINDIMDAVDMDKNGYVDYCEFLTAAVNK